MKESDRLFCLSAFKTHYFLMDEPQCSLTHWSLIVGALVANAHAAGVMSTAQVDNLQRYITATKAKLAEARKWEYHPLPISSRFLSLWNCVIPLNILDVRWCPMIISNVFDLWEIEWGLFQERRALWWMVSLSVPFRFSKQRSQWDSNGTDVAQGNKAKVDASEHARIVTKASYYDWSWSQIVGDARRRPNRLRL